MSEQTDLHLVLSRALDTDELSLEHDTMVVSVEVTKQLIDALSAAAATSTCAQAPPAEPVRSGL